MDKNLVLLLLLLLVLSVVACRDKSSAQTSGRRQDTVSVSTAFPASISNKVVLDTTGVVKGYETQRYILVIPTTATYSVTTSSANTGFIFVIQDREGNNVTEEVSTWSGKLEKGNYTLIAGLTRNAARDNENREVRYSIKAEEK